MTGTTTRPAASRGARTPVSYTHLYRHFTPEQVPGVKKLNNPTITDKVNPAKLKASWGEIRRLIYEILPEPDALVDLMKLSLIHISMRR